MSTRTEPPATQDHGRRSPALAGSMLAAILLFLVTPHAAGQQQTIPGTVKGFSVPTEFFPAPHQSQMKTLIQGAEARPLPGGRVVVSQAKLQRFREDGSQELLVQTPECVYDQGSRTLSSTGRLEAQTGDGKFLMSGEGFLWQQTNSSLTISNRVRTRVQTDTLAEAKSQPSATDAGAAEVIEIGSDQFDYLANSGQGIYQGNVHVAGTNLDLTAGKLTILVPMQTRQLETIAAQQDVKLDYILGEHSRLHGTGQEATYSALTGLLRVGGNPAWEWEGRRGRGDEFIIDRTNKVLQATGNAWVQLPGQRLGPSTFLTGDNANPGPSQAATNQFIEIVSDSYEVRTNWAVFRGPVRVTDRAGDRVEGTLNCSRLTALFAGTNSMQKLVAEEQVVIEQAVRRFTAGKAVYTATNGLLELQDHPTWQAAQRSGKGELITVDSARKQMQVRGNASMRFPAVEIGGLAGLSPAKSPRPRIGGETNQVAEIFSEEYTIQTEKAQFSGGVYISHPRINWACENLTVGLPPEGGKVEHIVAEQAVVFDLVDEKGQKVHGVGDKAVYSLQTSSGATNEAIYLTGNPCWLRSFGATGTTNGLVRSPTLVVDLTRHKFVVPPGPWAIRGSALMPDTNSFRLPQPQRRKGKG